jgi:hypothetical protein
MTRWKMFKWISSLGHRMVDWLYENTLGISSTTDRAKFSPEEIREAKLRLAGYDPATGRKIPKAGSAGDGDGPSNAPRVT